MGVPYLYGATPLDGLFRGSAMCYHLANMAGKSPIWLVVWNMNFIFPCHIWDVILPIDELHHFSKGYCTTNQPIYSRCSQP